MTRVKEKAVQRGQWPGRGGSKGGDVISDHINPEESDEELPTNGAMAPVLPGDIVREKVLLLENRMSPDEAVDQLEAVGHDFFVFIDGNDGAMKVVYRRRLHGYGLLIPQVQDA